MPTDAKPPPTDSQILDWIEEHPLRVGRTTQGRWYAVIREQMPRFDTHREACIAAMLEDASDA